MTGFYAYTGAGSEVDQDAAWEYIRHGYLLCPRTVLKGRTKIPQFELPSVSVDLDNLPYLVHQKLEDALGKMAGSCRAVMFSGGFDSMLIACLARDCGAEVTALTVQFDDFNPSTVAGAVEVAGKIGIDHHILHVNAVEFLFAFEILAGMTDEPLLDLDLAVVYAALKKYDRRIAGDMLISGMGSDQWFGNEALKDSGGSFAARLDWSMVDENAHQQVARVHGCKFVFPFLSGPMLALSQSVPAAMKKDKKLLREIAVAKTIPHRSIRSEIQVPLIIRNVLIKKYGDRAWPSPVSVHNSSSGNEQILRQIILGLWLEKVRQR